ncbi:MAG: FMN-binding glutamate synthase family protein, partial [Bacteroidetes bacterium SW_10_40_5]
MYKYFLISVLIVIVLVLLWASFQPQALWVFIILGPLILLGLYDLLQKNHTILRNFPVIGHFRYLFESIRPEINQYFVESDIEGRPFNRINRSIIYQRAKDVLDKEPFGTRMDYYETGYEWLLHSASPVHELNDDMRITIGGPDCKKPYSASILNISALSFGSLSGK